MAETVLKVDGLGVNFKVNKKNVSAVEGISFTLDKGEILGIVGESGCGKSVTANAIMGLLPRYTGKISGGSVILGDKELTTMSEKEQRKVRGKEISMIFQEPMTSLNPVYTVGSQMVEMAQSHTKMSKKEALELSLEMLRKVEIPEPEQRLKEYPHQLSGGMRQRVMIAMALACRPRILIADEPTTALDVTIQAQILKLMNELKRTTGTSIIFITHDLGVINEMADDVVVMYCGQVVEQAPAKRIFARDTTMSHPYTEGLMNSIPRLDNKGEKLEPIPGVVPHPLALPKGCKFAPRCKYCTQRCIDEEPALVKVGDDQLIRCFYPNKEARNSAEHKEKVISNQ